MNKYYWKQINYLNDPIKRIFQYRLIGLDQFSKDFESYEKMYAYCVKHKIDAICA